MGCILAFCSACSLFSDTTYVSDDVIEEVVGPAKIIADAREETNGSSSVEVRYLILDVGGTESNDAVAEVLKRLESLGWSDGGDDIEGGARVFSEKQNAVVRVISLDRFLSSTSTLVSSTKKSMEEKVGDPAGLIVVSVQPRLYDE